MSMSSPPPHITVIDEAAEQEQRALVAQGSPDINALAGQEALDYTKMIALERARLMREHGAATEADYLHQCLLRAYGQHQGWLFVMGYVLATMENPDEGSLFTLVGSGHTSMHEYLVSEGFDPQECTKAKLIWEVWSLYENYTTVQEVLQLRTTEHLLRARKIAGDLNRQAQIERGKVSASTPEPQRQRWNAAVEVQRQQAMKRTIGDLIQTPAYDLKDKTATLGTPTLPPGLSPALLGAGEEQGDDEEKSLFGDESDVTSLPEPYRIPTLYIEAHQDHKRLQLVVNMDMEPDQVDLLATLLYDGGAGFNATATWEKEPATLKLHQLAERLRHVLGYYDTPGEDTEDTLE